MPRGVATTAGRIPPCRGRSKRSSIATPSPPTSRSRAPPRPARAVWAVVKADAYGHGIANVLSPALQARRRLRAARHRRGRAAARARLARPDPAARRLLRRARPRDLLAPAPLARRPRRGADRLARRAQDRPAAPRLPEDEQRHEPARLRARERYRAAWLRLDALAQVERDRADDAPRRTPMPTTSPASSPRSPRSRRRRTTCPGERSVCNSAATLRFGARLAAGGARLGAARHPALRLVARPSACTAPTTGACAPAMTLRTRLIAIQDARRRRRASATAAASPPSARCASASPPAATPTAIRASRRAATSAARRCSSTACARAPSAASRWT